MWKSTTTLNPSAPDLTRTADNVLVGRQLLEAHGAAGVELVGADADLGAEAELVAVVEARRGVPEHDGAVDAVEEFLRDGGVLRHDRVRVVRAMGLDVLDGGIDPVDDPHREDEVEEFGAVVRLGGRGDQG